MSAYCQNFTGFNFANGSFKKFRLDLISRIVISRDFAILIFAKMAKNREFAKFNPAMFNPIKVFGSGTVVSRFNTWYMSQNKNVISTIV